MWLQRDTETSDRWPWNQREGPQCPCVTQDTRTTDDAGVLLGLGCLNSPVLPLRCAHHIQDSDFDLQYCQKDKIEVQQVGGDLEIKSKVYLSTNFLLKI